MKLVLFGASGMIGQGVLREALLADDVTEVLVVGRSPLGRQHPKLRELVHRDFTDFSSVQGQLTGYDVCAWCLGVASSGMSEADYTRVTYDYTMAAAKVLLSVNPQLVFLFVSGASTDSTEKGKVMWARVKGRTENALLAMPFKGSYMFRPGFIRPMNGETSRTPAYRWFYLLARPLFPLVERLWPRVASNTESIGRAMLNLARHGFDKRILEPLDINAAAEP